MISYLRASQRGFREMRGTAIDGLATGECAARGSRYGASVVRKGVVKVVAVNDVHITDEGVPNVDALPEAEASTEPGAKRFAKTQREPANTEAAAKPEASAEKADARGAID